jgi:hypothetical protein
VRAAGNTTTATTPTAAKSVAQEKAELQQMLREMQQRNSAWLAQVGSNEAAAAARDAQIQSLLAAQAAAKDDRRAASLDRAVSEMAVQRFETFQSQTAQDKLLTNTRIDLERRTRMLKLEEEKRERRRIDAEERQAAGLPPLPDITADPDGLPPATPKLQLNVDSGSGSNSGSILTFPPHASGPVVATTTASAAATPASSASRHTTSLMSPMATPMSVLSTSGIQLSPAVRAGASPSQRAFGTSSSPRHTVPGTNGDIGVIDEEGSGGIRAGRTGASSVGGSPVPSPTHHGTAAVAAALSSAATGSNTSSMHNSRRNSVTLVALPESVVARAVSTTFSTGVAGGGGGGGGGARRSSASSSLSMAPSLADEIATTKREVQQLTDALGGSYDIGARVALLQAKVHETPEGPARDLLLAQLDVALAAEKVRAAEEAHARRRSAKMREQDDMRTLLERTTTSASVLLAAHAAKRASIDSTSSSSTSSAAVPSRAASPAVATGATASPAPSPRNDSGAAAVAPVGAVSS